MNLGRIGRRDVHDLPLGPSRNRDLDQRRALAPERRGHSRSDRVSVVRPDRGDAHRGRERLEVDRRSDDLHADEAAGDGVGVAEAFGDVLQDAVTTVVEHEEDDLRPIMGGAPQGLRRVHRPAVADERGDEPGAGQRRADRRGHVAAEHAAAREEIAAGPGHQQLLHLAEGRRGIVGDQRVVGQGVERRQHRGVWREGQARVGKDLRPQRGLSRAFRGRLRRQAGLDRLAVHALAQAFGRRAERRADVADQRHVGGVLAAEGFRVVGDVQHRDAFRHWPALAIGIGDEGAPADEHDRLGMLEMLAHDGEVGFQHPRPARMGRREGGARGQLCAPDRKAACFRKGDETGAHRGRKVVAEHHQHPAGIEAGELVREPRCVRRGRKPGRGGGRRRRTAHLLIENVHRQRQKDGSAGRRAGDGEGAPQRLADVVAAAHLLGPFGDRGGERDKIAREPRLSHQVAGVLLARGDDERRLAGLGSDQHAHGVAEAAHGVQVDERGPARRQRPAVRHRHRRRLLQPEDVGDVRSVDQRVHEGHFGRAGVAEDVGDRFVAKDVEQNVAGASGHERLLFPRLPRSPSGDGRPSAASAGERAVASQGFRRGRPVWRLGVPCKSAPTTGLFLRLRVSSCSLW